MQKSDQAIELAKTALKPTLSLAKALQARRTTREISEKKLPLCYGTARVAVTSPLALVLQIVEIVALPTTQAQLGTPPHAAGRALQT
jgi:hypothetical protein